MSDRKRVHMVSLGCPKNRVDSEVMVGLIQQDTDFDMVGDAVDLPAGYAVEFSGQYEQMQEANARLKIAIPAAIALIFLLLMLHFGRLDRTLIIMARVSLDSSRKDLRNHL